MVEIPKCSSYEEQFIQDYGNSINTGEILYRKECRCLGTKEQEICSCGGDEEKCDFFPEKEGQSHVLSVENQEQFMNFTEIPTQQKSSSLPVQTSIALAEISVRGILQNLKH